MSVLLVREPDRWIDLVARALVERLVKEGDEVRIIEEERERGRGEEWRRIGGRVAWGSPMDPDLVERAAQGARSIVAIVASGDRPGVLSAAKDACAALRRHDDEVRLIVAASTAEPSVGDDVRSAGAPFVLLVAPPTGVFRRGVRPDDVAEAIDAADDLSGRPSLELDLRDAAAWAALGLAPR